MSKFTVLIQPSAQKDIARLDKPDQKRVLKTLESLSQNPRPVGCKKLVGVPAWRVRVGQLRIVYLIEDEVLRVEVVRVAHRKEVYR